MVQLAQFADVATRSMSPIPDSLTDFINARLTSASARICKLARQDFVKQQTTVKVRPVGGKLTLPQRPVVSVESVFVIDYQQNLVPIAMPYWDGGDEVWLDHGQTVINLAESIRELFAYNTPLCQVTYTHGYDQVPDEIIDVACEMVLRALAAPGNGAVQSQTAGPFSQTLTATGAAGALAMTKDERETVLTYRRPGRTIELR